MKLQPNCIFSKLVKVMNFKWYLKTMPSLMKIYLSLIHHIYTMQKMS